MPDIKKDEEYIKVVDHILKNEEYNKINKIEHHGITRYNHCVKVSYYSYKVAKALKLNYVETARGGLLHDFFLSEQNRTDKERLISTFVHPKKAVQKSEENFKITEREKDIIKSHMFPINPSIPKYSESWIVSIVDKCVGGYELVTHYSYSFKYALNYLYVFILFNIINIVK